MAEEWKFRVRLKDGTEQVVTGLVMAQFVGDDDSLMTTFRDVETGTQSTVPATIIELITTEKE